MGWTACLACRRPRTPSLALYLKKKIQQDNTCNSSTQTVEAGEPEVPVYPQLKSELEASLGYLRPFLQKTKSKLGWGDGPACRLLASQVQRLQCRPPEPMRKVRRASLWLAHEPGSQEVETEPLEQAG